MKELLRYILFFLKRKKYKIKLYNGASLVPLRDARDKYYFFGYYDRSPERNGQIIFHEMNADEKTVSVIARNLDDGAENVVAKVPSFNWQMGCRALWIDDDTITFNDFYEEKYICKWYSLSKKAVVKEFQHPLQDYSAPKNFFIGVNYQRLRSYAKEYGYYCLPEMTDEAFDDYESDGLWFVDTLKNESQLLVSIAEVIRCSDKPFPVVAKHFVNHVMINPVGNAFIFIHRYYVDGKRYDRLMYYDFNKLKCLSDGRVQSHYCWLNDNEIFGYGIVNSLLGFHTINVLTGTVQIHSELNKEHPKDGHPTCNKNLIVIDSYPDLSRMQSLTLYDLKSHEITKIAEFFHSIRNKGYNRCDLHPRFSSDGKKIYVDTIYTGARQLVALKLNRD